MNRNGCPFFFHGNSERLNAAQRRVAVGSGRVVQKGGFSLRKRRDHREAVRDGFIAGEAQSTGQTPCGADSLSHEFPLSQRVSLVALAKPPARSGKWAQYTNFFPREAGYDVPKRNSGTAFFHEDWGERNGCAIIAIWSFISRYRVPPRPLFRTADSGTPFPCASLNTGLEPNSRSQCHRSSNPALTR